jgi:hypothetical protein
MWIGICLGVAVNLKAHAGFYFLPLLVDVWWVGRWKALLIATGSSAVTFMLPFLAPGISLHDYLAALAQQVGGRGQTSSQLPAILITFLLLLLPVVIPLTGRRQTRRAVVYAAVTVATAGLLFYPATFPGAGAYHFLPLVPVLADVRQRLRPQGMDAALTPFVILLAALPASSQTSQMLAAKRDAAVASAEALRLARESLVQPVQVGYGDNRRSYELSQLSKTILALNSYPVLVDAQILMELHQIGIDGSTRWIPDLTKCRIGAWLLPKGETPFSVTSYFYDGSPLFSALFRQAFFDNYRPVKSTENFEVWECAASHSAGAGRWPGGPVRSALPLFLTEGESRSDKPREFWGNTSWRPNQGTAQDDGQERNGDQWSDWRLSQSEEHSEAGAKQGDHDRLLAP